MKKIRRQMFWAFRGGYFTVLTLWWNTYFNVSLSQERGTQFLWKLEILEITHAHVLSGQESEVPGWFPALTTCWIWSTAIPSFNSPPTLVNSQLVSSLPPVGILNKFRWIWNTSFRSTVPPISTAVLNTLASIKVGIVITRSFNVKVDAGVRAWRKQW